LPLQEKREKEKMLNLFRIARWERKDEGKGKREIGGIVLANFARLQERKGKKKKS